MADEQNVTLEDEGPDGFSEPDATGELEAHSLGGEPTDPETPSQDIEEIKQQWKASSSEARRLKQENEQLKLMQQQYQWQIQQAQNQANSPPPEPAEDVREFMSSEEADQYSDAVINGDGRKLQEITNKAFSRMERSFAERQQAQAQRSSELQNAVRSIRSIEELKDPNSPVTAKTWQRYQQIVNDPVEMAGIKQETIPINWMQINPFALKIAAKEAKSSLSESAKKAERTAHTEDLTPSSRPSSPDAPKAKFDPKKHLSKQERDYIERMRQKSDPKYDAQRYWENLEKARPGVQEARLKAGKPV